MAGLITRMRSTRRRKLSFRIGLLFLTLMIAIELGLFASLYLLAFNTYVKQEVNNLVVRGDNYSRVLAVDFSSEMIRHAVMTGIDNSTTMVVQNADNQTLSSSQTVNAEMAQHIKDFQKSDSTNSQSLHYHLFGDNYIVSMSSIKSDSKLIGRVYMFLDTAHIRQILFEFTGVFTVLAFLTLLLTVFAALYISRFITQPILKMTDGAKKIAKGELSLMLDVATNDELQDLVLAIEDLARDLDYMKKQRNEFLAAVAHELRTPLTFIKGYADIAARPATTPDERENYLTIIREEIGHITRLTEDLMTLAQLDENTFKIHKSSVNVSRLIEHVERKIKPIFEQKNLKLHQAGNPDFVAELDETRIEQVLMNLLTNAYKYSSENSVVTLSVSADTKQLRMIIADEGEGIPDSELPHIFERFYRVDKSRSRKIGGAGLGLAIAYDIVKLQGGDLTVHSEVGKGTRFIINIPFE